jgi:predicted nucleic acid-binding protein
MRVVDSSVVISALTHDDAEIRGKCRDELESTTVAVAHVLFESYAKLTSLPSDRRLQPDAAWQVLRDMFPEKPLTISNTGVIQVLNLMSIQNIGGGAVYDCLIAETARERGATLISRDKRAMQNYARIGVDAVII